MEEDVYNFLVLELKEHQLTAEEIKKRLNEHKMKSSKSAFDNCIRLLTFHYPLYEVNWGTYKILTDKDLEDYRNKLRLKIKHKE